MERSLSPISFQAALVFGMSCTPTSLNGEQHDLSRESQCQGAKPSTLSSCSAQLANAFACSAMYLAQHKGVNVRQIRWSGKQDLGVVECSIQHFQTVLTTANFGLRS
jgi:hypothetical protein